MPVDVKIWDVSSGDQPVEIKKGRLDLEERLERWMERDVSALSDDMLVIGRQVPTDYGGFIDLLCLDSQGDVVIVELKRDKTPREVIAQVLDYASWVRDLSGERVITIAEDYFGKAGGGPLDEAFKRKFHSDLPEELNKHHQMLIVASEIDSSTERIIKYLSETDGIGINAATFGFYRTEAQHELLARTYLLDPRDVETKTVAARKPNLTLGQLQEIADSNGVGDLYRQLVTKLEGILGKPYPRRILLAFALKIEESTKAIFNVLPGESSAVEGLKYQAYTRRLSEHFGLPVDHIEALLPAEMRVPWQYYTGAPADYSGCAGYFRTAEQIDHFVNGLTKAGTEGA